MPEYCRKCGRELPDDADYCPGCGTLRAAVSHESSGGASVGGSVVSGGNIENSFNVNNFGNDGRVPTRTWRSRQRKLPLSEPPAWAAALGIVGSLASLLAFVQGTIPYGVAVALLVAFLLVFLWWTLFKQLRREGYVSLGWLNNWSAKSALESDGEGNIYYTKIEAECPYCQVPSRMDLRNDDERTAWLVCRRNPRLHRLRFDHTQVPTIDSD